MKLGRTIADDFLSIMRCLGHAPSCFDACCAYLLLWLMVVWCTGGVGLFARVLWLIGRLLSCVCSFPQRWLKTRSVCPLCNKEWEFAKIERIPGYNALGI